jgi:flagellar L-ring protein precursor FlgH
MLRCSVILCLALILPFPLTAKDHKQGPSSKSIQGDTLATYLSRVSRESLVPAPASPGSLWSDNGRLAVLAGDYKALQVGDILTIVVSQDVSAQNAGTVQTSRSFNASSGISALGAHLSTGGVQNLFSPSSTQSLTGKSQASTTSSLTTSLAGRIAAVLPNGVMVVEAERQVTMNNERQTLLVRGLVRPGDVSPTNTVSSNAIGNLQLELKGKGVLSDGVRPPNFAVRWLLRLLGF